MLTASWGWRIASPPSASTRPGEEKKTNFLALQEGHKQRSIPALPALLFLWKTSFICVGTVPHRILCTSKPVHFPLCISVHQSVHLSTLISGQTSQRKVLTKDFHCFTSLVWMLQPLRTFEWKQQLYFIELFNEDFQHEDMFGHWARWWLCG